MHESHEPTHAEPGYPRQVVARYHDRGMVGAVAHPEKAPGVVKSRHIPVASSWSTASGDGDSMATTNLRRFASRSFRVSSMGPATIQVALFGKNACFCR